MKAIALILILFVFSDFCDAQSIIVTVAGNGTRGYKGDSGLAINSVLNVPDMFALDKDDNIYFGDAVNNRVRKISAATGIITTIAGPGTVGILGDNGPAINALLNFPDAFAFDTAGNLYVGEAHGSRIRKIDGKTGIITTFAGTGVWDYNGDGISATSANVGEVIGMCTDKKGNLYFADYHGKRVRKIDISTGLIWTYAGVGVDGYGGDGGLARYALVDAADVFADSLDNIYIADEWNHRVRKVDAVTGIITTIAGNGLPGSSGDHGLAKYASVDVPRGLFIDKNQNIYIAEEGSGRIRRIDAVTGIITTVAGTTPGYFGDGGLAVNAKMQGCTDVFVDSKGVMYIADAHGERIRKVYTPDSITNSNVCLGDSITLHRNMPGGTWICSDTGIAIMDTLVDKVVGKGLGTISIIHQNNVFSEKFTVSVLQLPFVTASISQITCYGLNNGSIVTSAGDTTGPYQYLWYFGDSATAVYDLAPGTYGLQVKDRATGCNIKDSFTITQPDSLVVTADIRRETCKAIDEKITIAVSGGTYPYRFLWSNNSTADTLTDLRAGTYTLLVTDSNSCSDNRSFIIEDTCNNILVHDAISPNGDGINDTWIIEGIQNYPFVYVQVFDKWGSLVYERASYNNEWGGNGTNNKPMPDGTYFYIVKLNAPNTTGDKNAFTGSVMIKR